ncbi:clan AA aspartic protease [Sphingobacterium alkalisoli]|uniref:Clan AA aspartic protease n=1 Tax=Sphingobacterium alkalisoli TaxID=1874115 RepID=A0A4U0GUG0_9SPHI|nr:aspartyl protease family protein [Sphingobacterium alkalisoli]TJY62608.1 clan AA aspartic protease [Sphingobacterium alkalisoli]GGH27753.1 hypothetical protein GCM10011418_37890 [Sphingobacterium alkalisoli]
MRLKDKKHIALSLVGLLFASALHAQLKDKSMFATALNKALQSKDTTGLSAFLANNFAIAGHTGQGAQFRLHQILKSYAGQEVRFISEEKATKGNVLTYQVTKTDGSKTNTQVLTDTAGKIRHVELFDQLYGMTRLPKSRLRAKIPFTNRNGSIILQVHINDFQRPLQLLFDTGADGMAVRKSLADSIGLQVTRTNNASVVGGNMEISVSDNNTIHLDTLILGGQGIAIFPEMSRDADGIIGNSLLRRFITHIDYDKNELSLYDFGTHTYTGKGNTVPVTMPSGVVILPGQLEIVQAKRYDGQFVFDTGASYDLICFRSFVRENKLLVSGFRPDAQGATVSMGINSPTFVGRSYGFALTPLAPMKNLPVTLMGGNATNENWNPGFDGSIGIRLLSRYNITINMAENEIFFSPNKLHEFPVDFILKDYLFGWDNQGTLRVLGSFGKSTEDGAVETGMAVVSIENFASSDFVKKPARIDELRERAKKNPVILKTVDQIEITL